MSKSMLINVILEEESRVAIVDNGILDFFEIETLARQTLKGNIYKGVVENVNSSLEAAFVNCGWEKPGFLPLDEVNFRVLPALKGRKGGSKIVEHLAPGMEVLVQVVRDRVGTKPPSVTTYYSLPGRYLVLMPFADSSGVSRRIEDEKARIKLKRLLDDLDPPDGYGVIVRTAGYEQTKRELVRDLGYLLQLWATIERAAGGARGPAQIYRERRLALRTIRDHLLDDIEEVLIDDSEVHESAVRFVRAIAPHQEPRIKLYQGEKPLFTRFNLEEQIESIYKRRVSLKSGGEIVIDSTEAMTAIDVNSSRGREANVEELALRTNLEAAAEIARQIRLRDIGGLIVVDFIDMLSPKNHRAVERALAEAMRRDKAKHDATKISKLGLLELSRQRLKAAKSYATYETCRACDGAGSVRTVEAAAIAALRRIQTRVVRREAPRLSVAVGGEIAEYLRSQQRDELAALERKHGVRIDFDPHDDYPRERCEIVPLGRDAVADSGSALTTPEPPVTRAAVDSARGAEPSRAGEGRHEADEVRIMTTSVGEGATLPSGPAAASAPGTAAIVGSELPGAALEGDAIVHAAGEGVSRKRRRRGGRAKGRRLESADTIAADASAPGGPPTAPGRSMAHAPKTLSAGAAPFSLPSPRPDLDEAEFEGRIVWEDDEESPASQAARAPGSAEAHSSGAPSGDVRRRRRRGGRGRERKAAAEPARAGTPAAIPSDPPPARDRGSAARSGSAGGEGGGRKLPSSKAPQPGRGSARGRKSVEAGSGSAGGGAEMPSGGSHRPAKKKSGHVAKARQKGEAGSSTKARPGRNRREGHRDAGADAPPTQGNAAQDAPGGWWSRMVGSKPRSGRGD